MSDTLHLLAHASLGNGVLGNQTGRELSILKYYNGASSGGWGRVYRFKDEYKEYADKAAEMQYSGVLNGYIGYSQSYRLSSIRCMIAHYFGLRYDTYETGHKYRDADGNAVTPDWPRLDVTKLRPWFVDREACVDCSSLTNTSFSIATGIWYHRGTSLDRATVFYGDTRPNNETKLSNSANAFYGDFCDGSWTPLLPVLSLWSEPYPCYSEETIDGYVEDYFYDVPDDLKKRRCTVHRIEFRLGQNNSTYRPVRNSYLWDGNARYDGKGNRICADLYQYKWEPFMDEYICDTDEKTLLRAVYEDGELKGYVNPNGDYLYSVTNNVAYWNNDAQVDGFPAQNINCPKGMEGATAAEVIAADTNRTHTYVPEDGQTGELSWNMDDSYNAGIRKNISSVDFYNSDGTFVKTTKRNLYYKTGYSEKADAAGAVSGDSIFRTTFSDDLKVLYAVDSTGAPRGGCVWVLDGGTPDSSDILFPMWSVTECELDSDMKFTFNGTEYTLVSGSAVEVKIVSTGTFYQHWIVLQAARSQSVTKHFVRAWVLDAPAVLPGKEGEEGGEGAKYYSYWFEWDGNQTFTLLDAPPFDTGDQSYDDTTEEDMPDDVIVKSILPVIQSDDNLKRGDILVTRKWSEGNTSGGHVAMYI